MATQAHELQYIENPAGDLPEPRSLAAMARDLDTLERDDLSTVTADLATTRRRARMHLSGVAEGGEAWRAALDEYLPEIDRLEAEAVSRLEAIRARVLSDREALARVPYRPGLSADQTAAAETKAAQLRARLPSMDAAAVSRAIQGAILFADPVDMSAWAMCSDDIAGRFPPDRKVTDDAGRSVYPRQMFREPLRQCEHATGDRETLAIRDRLEGTLHRLNSAMADITSARNGHDPSGNVGSLLARYQFGRTDGPAAVARERRYDPQAVARRLGAN